jgi:hypothetical protein
MDQSAFKQAVLFAFADIRREIALAKVSQAKEAVEALQRMGVPAGGANFLAALGLLCYTEFAGKLKYNKIKNGNDWASENFNCFFDDIGPAYKAFRAAGHNVYNIYRCGLAHEFFVKRPCEISIVAPAGTPGIGRLPDGRYYFAVENYCHDLERAFTALEKHLFPAPGTSGPPSGPVTASGYIAGT